MPGKIGPVVKRGGARRVVRHRARRINTQATPETYYKGRKGSNIFPKKLSDYRFVFWTDLSGADEAALLMFTAWVKANERYFDARTHFPIYAMVVGDADGSRVKTQRAREFLSRFGDLLQWSDPEHHLYKGYNAAGNRVWNDSSPGEVLETEESLVEVKDALVDPDYPESVSLETGIEELLRLNPTNLFMVYLKKPSGLDDPELVKFLRRAPGMACGPSELFTPIMDRGKGDAPLLHVEHPRVSLATPKLFERLEDIEDYCEPFAGIVHAWNDAALDAIQALDAFSELNLDDPASLDGLSAETKERYADEIKLATTLVKNHGWVIDCSSAIGFIAALIGCGTLKSDLFSTSAAGTNGLLYTLRPRVETDDTYTRNLKKLIEAMMLAAVKVVDA
jgi:hypothetical protein